MTSIIRKMRNLHQLFSNKPSLILGLAFLCFCIITPSTTSSIFAANLETTSLKAVTGKIGDFTFFDSNRDGIYMPNDGDMAMGGVKIYLFNSMNTTVPTDSTISDIDGFYEFDGLDIADSYKLKFVGPPAYTLSPNIYFSINGQNSVNSDGFTEEISFTSIVNVYTIDAGFVEFIKLRTKLLLQGPAELITTGGKPGSVFNAANYKAIDDWQMNNGLNSEGLVPLKEPYSDIPSFNPVGDEAGLEVIDDPSILLSNGPKGVVDWVFVEIRNSDDPKIVEETQAAILLRDGTVVNTKGSPVLEFSVESGEYYVAVRHRNHLGAMMEFPAVFGEDAVEIDFRDPELETYGENGRVSLDGNTKALWAGNADADDKIVYQGAGNDANGPFFEVLAAPENTDVKVNYIFVGYNMSDFDMNCSTIYQGGNNDLNIVFFNIITHPENLSASPSFIIHEQLPK